MSLVVLLVVAGLLNIPVECSLVAGPHSMFLSATAIAELQHGAMPDMTDMPPHTGTAAGHPTSPKEVDDASGSDHAPPTPAGFASDAVPLRASSGPWQGPRLIGPPLRISTEVAALPARLLTGPEPPPPNAG